MLCSSLCSLIAIAGGTATDGTPLKTMIARVDGAVIDGDRYDALRRLTMSQPWCLCMVVAEAAATVTAVWWWMVV